MPGMDGFQVLAEKSRDPSISSIPIIIISARDPMGEPMLGITLSISQSGGFTVANLRIACKRWGMCFLHCLRKENSRGDFQPCETPLLCFILRELLS